jgi:2-keto-4-pentenoate hydratase/2-oxohepta-3-ene-1,7-dioic acid hydratase in catechol pathway
LSAAWPLLEGRDCRPLHSIKALINTGKFCAEYLGDGVAQLTASGEIDGLRLEEAPALALPMRPAKLICLGRNYVAHAAETGHDPPREPILFAKSVDACIGPCQPIVVQEAYGRVDHEAELAVVIGRPARGVPPEAASRHVAGYTVLNDVTARDIQKADIAKGRPWFRSKSFDTFAPLGPVIVPRDALSWPPEAEVICRVNGEVRQHSNTSRFIFGLEEVIAYVSAHMTLKPGDIIATGTPEGISPIQGGDRVEAEVEGIGTLRNPVVET